MAERVSTSIEELSRSAKSTEVPRHMRGGRRPYPRGRAPTTHVEESNSRRERSQGPDSHAPYIGRGEIQPSSPAGRPLRGRPGWGERGGLIPQCTQP